MCQLFFARKAKDMLSGFSRCPPLRLPGYTNAAKKQKEKNIFKPMAIGSKMFFLLNF